MEKFENVYTVMMGKGRPKNTAEEFALCKQKFEVGKTYLDTNTGYGVFVKQRKGNEILVDVWYVSYDDGLCKGERNCWEKIWVDGDREAIGCPWIGCDEYGNVFEVHSDCVIK